MKKTVIICFASLLFGITTVSAQGILDKIDKAADRVDRASNTADNAAAKGDKAGKLVGKLGKLFKKKSASESDTENNKISGNKTTVSVSGSSVTFAQLKKIQGSLEASSKVKKATAKLNAKASSIIVIHQGSTEDLLKEFLKNSKDFTEDNVTEIEDGKISLEIKNKKN
ncbi:hypothetical protein BWD42_07125 [Sphingobacterium sp. CZ-UAM]|uniref:hypothetical protein n=1 Tax=Sphingobacterium sp. CZ-UAM TaxID=1933868 RepID=UPI000985E422|nr:hypothetical protein [Sphingobacterium sp. CZ-UAM]OOG19674.1 hypothetical protein BWD42_07125 [Sphingobacterium sp. CZ-UAM]